MAVPPLAPDAPTATAVVDGRDPGAGHPVAETALLGSIAVFHVVDFQAVPEHWHVVSHLGAGLVAVASAAALGASTTDLGLRRSDLGAGLRRGLASVAVTGAVVAAAVASGRFDDAFDDPRVADLPGGEVARRALLDIPVGTAVYEELVFRSALLGLALRRSDRLRAVVASSALFGLWHILPAVEDRRRGHLVGDYPALATIVPTVVGTGLAGAWLAHLRMRTGSVLAPILAHTGTNVAALLGAAAVSRRRRDDRAGNDIAAGSRDAP